MPQPFVTHQCLLSTLSPLHLGCGQDYQPTGYVMRDGYLHAFGEQQLAQGLGPQGMKRILDIIERGDDSALRGVQNEIYQQADKLVPLASHSVWAAHGVSDLYQKRVGQVAQREERRSAHNKLEIQRTFANPYDQRPVLTGSAVKGAIRTAWLDYLNNGQPLEHGERHKELQQRLLGSGRVEEDPFYLLKVSDASYAHPDKLMSGEIWFAVGVKRKPVEGQRPTAVNTMLECIGPWRSRCFNFDIRFLDGSLRRTSKSVPQNREQLIAACNRYYLPKLVRELKQLTGTEYLDQDWAQAVHALLAGELGNALENNRAMLLRLGKHSGAEDKTLNGVRSIMIKGKSGAQNTYRAETTEVCLASHAKDAQKGLLPFGWVLVEFSDQHLDESKGVIRRAAEPVYQRQQQEQSWIALRDEARERAMGEAEEQARRKADQQAAEEAEQRRAQELASQPLEVQIAEAFRVQLSCDAASKGNGLGSALGQALRDFIEQAAQWPPEYRILARQLVNDAFIHLDVNRKKNAKAKELWRTLGDD